jgi:hypothetical protein
MPGEKPSRREFIVGAALLAANIVMPSPTEAAEPAGQQEETNGKAMGVVDEYAGLDPAQKEKLFREKMHEVLVEKIEAWRAALEEELNNGQENKVSIKVTPGVPVNVPHFFGVRVETEFSDISYESSNGVRFLAHFGERMERRYSQMDPPYWTRDIETILPHLSFVEIEPEIRGRAPKMRARVAKRKARMADRENASPSHF